MNMDLERLDREQKDSWSRAAGAWDRRQAELREQTEPVARWLVDALDPQPGAQLLELAAGPGETGFMAVARVGPDGSLICSDQSEEMVAVARARAAELGLDNVELRVLDAQRLDLESASVDAVLCRWGYMLMADRDAALRETHRVLRPGGRLALATWDTPDRNMWIAAPVLQLVARGAFTLPQPGEPSPFSMADQEQVARDLDRAGFHDVHVQRLEYANGYADFGSYWELIIDFAAPVADALAKLDQETVAAVREDVRKALAPFLQADGRSLSIPSSAVVAHARA
jgi:ubiquinone/menaquinone biosynthesis C-methylase UbiE